MTTPVNKLITRRFSFSAIAYVTLGVQLAGLASADILPLEDTPINIYGHGLVEFKFPSEDPISITGWELWTADSDQGVQVARFNPTGLLDPLDRLVVDIPTASYAFGSCNFANFCSLLPEFHFFDPVNVLSLEGSTVSQPLVLFRVPNLLTPGQGGEPNAYSVALFDADGNMQSFFQLRIAGTSATVLDTSLTLSAVDEGLWVDVEDYIEYDPGAWSYFANVQVPRRPADYSFYAFPEPASQGLIVTFLMIAAAQRRSVGRDR